MAMAPWFVQAQLLYAAIDKAAPVLRAPIDRIEVTSGKILFRASARKILFWARTRKLAISYRYVADPCPNPGASAQLLLDGEATTLFNAVPRTNRVALPPWGERQELLNAAICKSTSALQAPIDRVEVTRDKILLRAGTGEFAISYQYVDNPRQYGMSPGFLLDGVDYWECFRT